MVEVFKTNVKDQAQANRLLDAIHTSFRYYEANFDLEDCDNILRVKTKNDSPVNIRAVANMFKHCGYEIEVLV